LCEPECRFQIYGQRAIEHLRGDRGKRGEREERRVVDQHIDCAKSLHTRCNERGGRLRLCEVRAESQRFSSFPRDLSHHVFAALAYEIRDDDTRTVCGKRSRNRATNALPCTGHDTDAAAKVEIHPPLSVRRR
jgi:hypothetical protein